VDEALARFMCAECLDWGAISQRIAETVTTAMGMRVRTDGRLPGGIVVIGYGPDNYAVITNLQSD